MRLSDLPSSSLGTRTVGFSTDDAILYALAVGAPASQLDLIWERSLRVLPTYGCALGLWAVEAAGELGAYDRARSLHVGQSLVVREPLSPGPVPMDGRIGAVYDKGRLTIIDIEVVASSFEARYTILLPGVGGWGGEPPPPTQQASTLVPSWTKTVGVRPGAAALYRLTGDKHPVHIDPSVAAAMGLERPILHGLATMGMTSVAVAEAVGAHPADLSATTVRFLSPVYPGCRMRLEAEAENRTVRSETSVDGTLAMAGTFTF